MKWVSISFKVTEELKGEIQQYFKDYTETYNKGSEYTLSQHLKSGVVYLMKQYYKKHPKS